MHWLRSLPFLVLLALAGCATPQAPALVAPPAHLLVDTPHPEVDSRTNGGLARAIHAYRKALTAANSDKAALREHFKDTYGRD
jgi:hypothetical protein